MITHSFSEHFSKKSFGPIFANIPPFDVLVMGMYMYFLQEITKIIPNGAQLQLANPEQLLV